MEELIASIATTLKDYREDEDNTSVQVSEDHITEWIAQFEEELQVPILTELNNIFKKRYCSKKNLRRFLELLIEALTKDSGLSSEVDFLKNAQFLSLQGHGKSQTIILEILKEVIFDKYDFSFDKCGASSRKYSIYIDDVLCSGLTLISNIQEWSKSEFENGKTNKQAVEDGSTKLFLNYIFVHEKNFDKKLYEMEKRISAKFSAKIKSYHMHEIQNTLIPTSKVDLIFPNSVEQPENVEQYRAEIIETVDAYSKEKGYKTSAEEFFRPNKLPKDEKFFTSPENRKLVEDAFLQKGIEILGKANVNNKNMRALGYSMPSVKSFGFGALCFTWRNVPNNTPLVFWYAGGGFTPLFKVSRGNNSAFNFTFDFSAEE